MSLLASAITLTLSLSKGLLAIVPKAQPEPEPEPEPERDNRALLADLADALSQRDAVAVELMSAQRKIDLLESQVDAAWERHASLAVELDHAHEDAQAWRQRALAYQAMPNHLAGLGLQQAAQAQQMAFMQQAQNAFAQRFPDVCNCVPARHDMLLRPR
jgi:hypothetical protein